MIINVDDLINTIYRGYLDARRCLSLHRNRSTVYCAMANAEPQAKRQLLAAGARPATASGSGQGTLLSLGARAPAPGASREARMAGLYDLQEVIGKVIDL